MATHRGGAQDGVRISFELVVRNGLFGGNLLLVSDLVSDLGANAKSLLTGSSSALIPSNGILTASSASEDVASR